MRAVREYVMTLLNSNYEEWRMQNPALPLEDFKFTTAKMAHSGSLFDLQKLDDVSKNTIAAMSAAEVTKQVLDWSRDFDPKLHALLSADRARTEKIFEIGRNDAKPRKDIAKWSEIRGYTDFFFDSLFEIKDAFPENVSPADTKQILTRYKSIYSEKDDPQQWFERVKELASDLGFAQKPKDYKNNPQLYKGHVGDISMVLRVAVTGKTKSPDLFSIMQILGKDCVIQRLCSAANKIKE